ncbi:helix-turn-helix domain-containing protein [Couchioplanes caeruleus]|uniref:helix-turn-helix domain-containing protein n=1 Tax=Couchioplanes caeruleus TaxID=56438 RepID=UPI0020BEEE92|nr:helix-turn-helix transcriptional regulator [Couchioplanes caeruleus]UQU68393.1 helix-turn-helix domain-containing protein [Couchioplanes caeruleus]
MAARRQPPTARLRRLAAELKRLRAASEHTRESVEAKTGINTATLYRIETARVRPQKRTLLALLDLYGVKEPAERDKLADLTRDSTQLDWLQLYEPELPEGYQTYISFEAEASRLQNYESLYVPGLLQTEAYARAVIRGVLPTETDEGVGQRVEVRMRRQGILAKQDPVTLWAVVDEAALRRVVGGVDVMKEQLDHLVTQAKLPTITLQVLPYNAGAHPGMAGSFLVMEFPDEDPALVYAESAGGGLFLESNADVARYRATFQHLVAQALSPAETMRFIKAAADAR